LIPLLLALAAQSPAPAAGPPTPVANYATCTALVKRDAEKAIAGASDWLVKGGGVLARQCLGLAYSELERWAPAAAAFEAAAREAETEQSPERGDFWVQAGNSLLAAGEHERARQAFDAALATTLLTPELRGEALLDRARAGVALGDLPGARRDLDKGLELVPNDPFAWYLSSALALKQNDLKRAQGDVAHAMSLAPDDADVLLHAGNVAGASGEVEAARTFFRRAVRAAPGTPTAKAAEAALAANSN
jgi:tetratricopeptide (TPR) repeat protein